MTRNPTVEILLGTKNGARWLPGQLASIAMQSGVDWSLSVSDDGSRDKTGCVLNSFKARSQGHRVSISEGPCAGSASNFLKLIERSERTAEFTALADQDDIWKPDRLSRAIEFLGSASCGTPCVYASRTWEIRNGSRTRRLSRRHRHDPCFQNALLQNVLAGNTIVMNRPAMDILRRASVPPDGVPFHDWWIYLLLSGAGARIILDSAPTVFYRQHDSNLIGSPSSIVASATRIRDVVRGVYRQWLDRNLNAISQNRHLLSNTSNRQLDVFESARNAPPPFRGTALATSGAFRQTRLGDICVFGAATLGRI